MVLRVRLHYVMKPCDIDQTQNNFITFNNGLGPLKTKSGGGFQGGERVMDFVLRGPKPILKSIQIVMSLISQD